MAETLYADSLASGAVSTPANAYGAPDGSWTTDTGNTNWTARFGLDNAVGTLQANQAIQITLRLRKESAGGGNPSVSSVTLYDGGTTLGSDATGWTISSATGQDITVNISATGITGNGDSLAVEVATFGVGGPPADRRAVQIDAVSVVVQNASPVQSGTGAGGLAVAGGSASGQRAHTGSASGSVVVSTLSAAGQRTRVGTAAGATALDGVASGQVGGFPAPGNLTATPVSTSQIDVSWDSVPTAIGYDLQRERWNGSAWVDATLIPDVVSTHDDTGLLADTMYRYRVRAKR